MTNSSVSTEFDSLRADFTQMRNDLAGLTKALGQRTSEGAAESLIDLKQAGKSARRHFRKAVHDADSLRQSGVGAIEQQISERPLAIMALAFGVGLLIGKVAHRS